jgi:hypothetical protein
MCLRKPNLIYKLASSNTTSKSCNPHWNINMKNQHILLQLYLFKQMLLTNSDTIQATITQTTTITTHNKRNFTPNSRGFAASPKRLRNLHNLRNHRNMAKSGKKCFRVMTFAFADMADQRLHGGGKDDRDDHCWQLNALYTSVDCCSTL